MKRISIDFLRINKYRNYESLLCNFHKSINVLTGLNGAGKTSVLDAIFYLSNGKSYFSHLDSVLYKNGDSFFNLSCQFSINEDVFSVKINSSQKKGKEIVVEDKIIKTIADHYGQFPAFMIAPKDILILVESSIERRKLIDRTISQVDKNYLLNLMKYNKLLKQRNSALKSFLKKGRRDELLIDALNKEMNLPAQYIFEKRKDYVNDIMPIANEYYQRLSEKKEIVTISYKSKLLDKTLSELFSLSANKDYILGKTCEGVHRDDLNILLNGQPIKQYGSQGQLKSAIIAIKLAQIKWVSDLTDKKSILLLDDIFDKLDKNRVLTFVELCAKELESQIFITDTQKERVGESLKKLSLEYLHLEIEEGRLINN